ncbi:PH domain-containing protein [Oceanicoccus sp. KOV_DT_Chl]|uniref:PH domain-containing protein n=1 Tax=Oceanicoccus sp. KOV_DT_Chl TaxID=1904639 RepID=UPI000C796E93|nr:PH domain-containing protein [Oceanicoccus sp. KOV_DT_Chl]
MRLDDGETLELEIKPNEKLLAVWFFTKTIKYSIATMFFVFMGLFFINTISLIFEEETEGKVDVVQIEKNSEVVESVNKKENNHPFAVMVDYWPWALLLVVLASIIIQIYLIYLRKTYRYIITNRRCIFVGGILKRIERTVPYKKITDIQRSQNILERVFGIWNVQVFTPGTASIQMGQAKLRAELNFDGLLNSEDVYEAINKYARLNE